MQQTVRSYLTAGVAVVGAGALALAPIQPVDSSLGDTRIPAVFSGPVGLAAISNPTYAEVFARASANIDAIVEAFFDQYDRGATPVQVIIENQTANLEWIADEARNTVDAIGTALTETVPNQIRAALDALGEGDFYTAVSTLVGAAIAPIAPLIFFAGPVHESLMSTLSNAVKALAFVTPPLALGIQLLSVVGPIINGAAAAVASVQAIVDSFDGGDPLREIINAPAAVLNGFLNGGYGPDFGGVLGGGLPFSVFAGGLLTGPGLLSDAAGPVPGLSLAGPLGAFLVWREGLADAIRNAVSFTSAAAPQQVSDVPDTNADFVSLPTDDPAEVPPVEDASFQKPAPEPSEPATPAPIPTDEEEVEAEGEVEVEEPTESEPVDATDDGDLGATDEGDDSEPEESVDVTGDDVTGGDGDAAENEGTDANDGGSDNGGATGDDTSGNGSGGTASNSGDKGGDKGGDNGSDGSDE